jgi:hypothetical protein
MKVNPWMYVEVVHHRSAVSYFRPELEIEHSSTPDTKCLLLTNLATCCELRKVTQFCMYPVTLTDIESGQLQMRGRLLVWSFEVRQMKSDARRAVGLEDRILLTGWRVPAWLPLALTMYFRFSSSSLRVRIESNRVQWRALVLAVLNLLVLLPELVK